MGPIEKSLRTKIEQEFKPSTLEIENESHKHATQLGAESHFKVLVVANAFEGLNRVKRQQKVYGLMATELSQSIHALSLRLMTPDEFALKGSEGFVSPDCISKHKT